MLILQTVIELKEWVRDTKKAGKTIGLVPTMGFLHEGHLSLVEKAKAENDKVVMSIFVNPAQFGPNEDFDRYPRDLKRDQELAKRAGTDVIFAPRVDEMYPRESQIQLFAGAQADVLCGAKRPGHFDGVLKVVTKLFHLTEADLAYFGQKDAQQLAIIESFVTDFNFPMAIRRGETVREKDGLAKSSRNVYLSDAERNEAPHLRKALEMGKATFLKGQDPIESMTAYLTEHTSGKIDYIELLDYPTLTTTIQQDAILALAVQFEKARLIDNIIFNPKEN
ncbi:MULTISPECIES: pantoate--beta-alanine ligase [Planococcus]|uniref:Pantothenate synthetase n=1 Tax=Planococcus faecalis TaxID=1598147 RepID=A0ABN4XIS9_9BACL|nr:MULTISPECIES: pantoate--beta-alanine ligase [Planococcus]AQU79617.1 pantoate--beta-alanine ligase [Planococcus faecalis]MDJ0331645.1 pantoate--beta-alanine ligase [Planococcus sp. S3-L1]OHX51545.1 pantoate--beta-alanine ligase [Planococcus faecalis]